MITALRDHVLPAPSHTVTPDLAAPSMPDLAAPVHPDRAQALPLSAMTAHELRAPLQALTTSIELLAEHESASGTPEAQSLTMAVLRQSLWLRNVVENLLCAAALEDGRFHLDRQPTPAAGVVAGVLPIARPLLVRKRQLFEVRVSPPARAAHVVVDRQKLSQALLNLLVNASKYAPAGTPIDLRLTYHLRDGAGWVRYTVLDRGPGVPQDLVTRLFDPFVRGPATAAHEPGMGLGLAIIRAIAAAHGGTTGVANRHDGGACFWIEIPAQPGDEVAPDEGASRWAARPSSS